MASCTRASVRGLSRDGTSHSVALVCDLDDGHEDNHYDPTYSVYWPDSDPVVVLSQKRPWHSLRRQVA